MPLYPGAMRHGLHNIIQGALLWFAYLLQDTGKAILAAGHRFEDWVAPSRVLGFKVSTWQDNKVARHLVRDTSDAKAMCGLPCGPFGWENTNHVLDRDIWPAGVCPTCLQRFNTTRRV